MTSPRLILVDQSLASTGGHHLTYNASLAEAARSRGLTPIILADLFASAELRARPDIRPTFSSTWYDDGRPFGLVARGFGSAPVRDVFADELFGALAFRRSARESLPAEVPRVLVQIDLEPCHYKVGAARTMTLQIRALQRLGCAVYVVAVVHQNLNEAAEVVSCVTEQDAMTLRREGLSQARCCIPLRDPLIGDDTISAGIQDLSELLAAGGSDADDVDIERAWRNQQVEQILRLSPWICRFTAKPGRRRSDTTVRPGKRRSSTACRVRGVRVVSPVRPSACCGGLHRSLRTGWRKLSKAM